MSGKRKVDEVTHLGERARKRNDTADRLCDSLGDATAPSADMTIPASPIVNDPSPIEYRGGFYYPKTKEQVQQLVKWARRPSKRTFDFVVHDAPGFLQKINLLGEQPLTVRVRGAGHSFPRRKTFTNSNPGLNPREVNIRLDEMRSVRWHDPEEGIVDVEAGINLRYDPTNPRFSDEENGLLQILSRKGKGWTLKDLGGIVMQTLGGYLSTGSAGGSLKSKLSLDHSIQRFTLVDGTGEIIEVDRQHHLFPSLGVSMGLLGIIVSVRLECTPLFSVEGCERFTTVEDCKIDLFGDGKELDKDNLEQFFHKQDYARILYYPLANKVGVWQANMIPKHQTLPESKKKLYENPAAKDPQVLGALVQAIFTNMQNWTKLPQKIEGVLMRTRELMEEKGTTARQELEGMHNDGHFGDAMHASIVKEALVKICEHLLKGSVPIFATLMVPLGKLLYCTRKLWMPPLYKSGHVIPEGPEYVGFAGEVWEIIPMDQEVDYELQPVCFTELWIPIKHTLEVMKALRKHIKERGNQDIGTGLIGYELYTGSASEFLMSPACDGPVFRLDLMWQGNAAGQPSDGFNEIWELMQPFDYKLHWGKYHPTDTGPGHDQAFWTDRLRKLYGENWDTFLAKRALCDPDNIFLTDYWRQKLGLQKKLPNPSDPNEPEPVGWIYSPEWQAAAAWIALYSLIMIVFMNVAGLGGAHVPFFLGAHYTKCGPYNSTARDGTHSQLICKLAVHSFQIPVYVFFTYFSVLGCYIAWKNVPYETSLASMRLHVENFASMFGLVLGTQLALALYEINDVFSQLLYGPPDWQVAFLLFLGVSLVFVSIPLGLFTLCKLNAALIVIRKSDDDNPRPMSYEQKHVHDPKNKNICCCERCSKCCCKCCCKCCKVFAKVFAVAVVVLVSVSILFSGSINRFLRNGIKLEVFAGVNIPHDIPFSEVMANYLDVNLFTTEKMFRSLATETFNKSMVGSVKGTEESKKFFLDLQQLVVNQSIKQHPTDADPVPEYRFFGNDNWQKILGLFLKENPFMAMYLTAGGDGSERFLELKAYDENDFNKTLNTVYHDLLKMRKGLNDYINIRFDKNMDIIKLEYYDKDNDISVAPPKKDWDYWVTAVLYELTILGESVHLALHVFHYILTTGFYHSTKHDVSLHAWAKVLMETVPLQYFGVAIANDPFEGPFMKILPKPAFLKVGSRFDYFNHDNATNATFIKKLTWRGYDTVDSFVERFVPTHEYARYVSRYNHFAPDIATFAKEQFFDAWCGVRTADEFVDAFLFRDLIKTGGKALAEEHGLLAEFRKMSDNVGPYAKDMTAAMKEDNEAAYDTANEQLRQYLRKANEGAEVNITDINSFIQAMTVTGIMHGSTLSFYRLDIIPEILRWRNISSKTWSADDSLCAHKMAAIAGMEEGRHVMLKPRHPKKFGKHLYQVMTKYEDKINQQTEKNKVKGKSEGEG